MNRCFQMLMVVTRAQTQSSAAITPAAQQPTIAKAAAKRARDAERAKTAELNRRRYAARQQQDAMARAAYIGSMKFLGRRVLLRMDFFITRYLYMLVSTACRSASCYTQTPGRFGAALLGIRQFLLDRYAS
jgi:hypothetical protein